MKKRPQRGLQQAWGKILVEVDRLNLGMDIRTKRDGVLSEISLKAPQGTVFKATGSHLLHERLMPNARDAYKALVRRLKKGLKPCREMKCEICDAA